MRTLMIEPLTQEAFAPFGDVIETDGSDHFMINNGSTMRFHRLAEVETATPEDKAIISIFRAEAQDMPFTVRMLERHPLGSQAFIPLLGKRVFSVHFQLLRRQQFAPEQRLGFDLAVGAALHEGALDRAGVRVVALEVQGVDHDFLDLARVAQSDDHPVIAWRATTCGFPAVAHVDATAWVEDVAHATEVFIGARQGATAIQCGSQVDLFVVTHRGPVAERHAIHTQASYAAVRERC